MVLGYEEQSARRDTDPARDRADGRGQRPMRERSRWMNMRPYLCIPYWTSPPSAGEQPDTGGSCARCLAT